MDNTPDVSHPCPRCNRYTCRCTEVERAQGLPPLPTEPVVWAPWMAARAANA